MTDMVDSVSLDDPTRTAVNIITGAWRSQALYAAVALGVPDHVAAGCTEIPALSAAIGAMPDAVTRLMRLLVALGVFAGAADTGYGLTPVGEKLRSDVDGSLRDMCLIYGEEFYEAWGAIVHAMTTGRSAFQETFGSSLHDYLANTPGAPLRFQRAMNAGSVFFADVARAFDFSDRRFVVDVAGGGGQLLSTVLRAHEHLRGLLFDLPHVVGIGLQEVRGVVGVDRADASAGDMFDGVPAGADVYLLSRVLQDWDDIDCTRLLTNCRAAMTDSARLLIVERVVSEEGSAILPLLWDLHLLVMAAGRERTLNGYRSLLAGAGLSLESVHPLALESSLLVAAPAGAAQDPRTSRIGSPTRPGVSHAA